MLLDGGFVIKKLQQGKRAFPSAEEIESLCNGSITHADLAGSELLRKCFYHAAPARDVVVSVWSRHRASTSL